jgi:glycosyltransferase involved in cell wall biosynthesis
MELEKQTVAVISHAGIRTVNRSVYRYLKERVKDLTIIIPSSILLKSGTLLMHEPPTAADPRVVPMTLVGNNPRTYYYDGLIAWLEANRPTVVLLENDPVSKLGQMISKWCKAHNSTLLCQTYENVFRDIGSTLRNQSIKALPKNLVIHTLNYLTALRVDGILIVNRESESIFKKYGYPRVTRIPLGYDKTVFFRDDTSREETRKKLGVDQSTMVIAFFGRLIFEKGAHILIDALTSVKQKNWKLLLDHAHDHEDVYSEELKKKIATASLSDKVLYFEANHIEIADYMRATDIMVAPSITTRTFKEQYGRTVQEAMACNCLCLVSNAGNLPDMVGNNEVVFPEGDASALARLIERAFLERDWFTSSSEELRIRAEGYLTSERQAHLIADLLAKL